MLKVQINVEKIIAKLMFGYSNRLDCGPGGGLTNISFDSLFIQQTIPFIKLKGNEFTMDLNV